MDMPTAEYEATSLKWCEEHHQWLYFCPIQIGDRDVFRKCMEAHDQKLREQIAQEIEAKVQKPANKCGDECSKCFYCPVCVENEVLQEAAAIARGKK